MNYFLKDMLKHLKFSQNAVFHDLKKCLTIKNQLSRDLRQNLTTIISSKPLHYKTDQPPHYTTAYLFSEDICHKCMYTNMYEIYKVIEKSV